LDGLLTRLRDQIRQGQRLAMPELEDWGCN